MSSHNFINTLLWAVLSFATVIRLFSQVVGFVYFIDCFVSSVTLCHFLCLDAKKVTKEKSRLSEKWLKFAPLRYNERSLKPSLCPLIGEYEYRLLYRTKHRSLLNAPLHKFLNAIFLKAILHLNNKPFVELFLKTKSAKSYKIWEKTANLTILIASINFETSFRLCRRLR